MNTLYIKRFVLLCLVLVVLHPALQAQQNFAEILRTSNNNFYTIKQRAETYFARVGKVGTGWKDYKRWEALVRPNISPDGKLPDFVTGNQQALESFRSTAAGSTPNLVESAVSNWQPLGQVNPTIEPGDNQNGTGALRCMEFSGTDVWVGTPGGGIWYGEFVTGTTYNWTPKTDGIPNLAIQDIEIAPINTTVMYALTGAIGTASGNRSTGVIKSTDSGNTWQTTGLNFPEDENVIGYKLLVHPANDNILWAATTNGLFRTADGGQTWDTVTYYTNANPALVNFTSICYDIQFQPGSTTTMYVTGIGVSFYKSIDGGATFLKVDMNAAGLPIIGSRVQIGLTPANSNYIYLLYGSATNNDFLALYRSTNGGTTFTLQSNSPNILGSQANRNIAIAVSPTNANDLYVGGLDIYKSTNAGVNWTKVSDWQTPDAFDYCHADIFELICTPTYLFCASDGGLYRMTRSNDVWATMNNSGMQTGQVYRIGIDPTAAAAFVSTGLQDNGTYKNSGAAYLSIGGGDGMETIVKPSNTNVIYVSAQYGSFSRSDDGGSNRIRIFNDSTADATCNCNEIAAWTAPAVLRPGNDNHIYIGYKNIFYNTTSGNGNWNMITTLLTRPIISLEFAPSNNTILYATDGNAVLRYNLSVSVWTQTSIESNLPNTNNFTELAVDPNDPNHVLITVGGYQATQKVYETFNANTASPTWTNIRRNLPNVPINCITMDNNAANTIYIGTDIGVFVTNDVLVNWIMYTNGLPTTRIYDLEINNALTPDRIYAGTFGRGVFYANTYTGCVANVTLSGSITGLNYAEAAQQITSSQIIDGGAGTSVRYNAGNAVILVPGYHIKSGSAQRVYIQGCTDEANPPLPLRRVAKEKDNR